MQGMEGTSSVDNATSAEDICKGEALVADLFSMPEGTGPQRDNAEGVSEGEVADPIVAPEGAGPQLEGDDAPLKAGSIPSLLSLPREQKERTGPEGPRAHQDWRPEEPQNCSRRFQQRLPRTERRCCTERWRVHALHDSCSSTQQE
jgi:hypothetical protein